MRPSLHGTIYAVGMAALVVSVGCMSIGLRPRLAVAVDIAPNANQNQAIAVDLVEINDKDLAKEVGKMSAADWFQKRAQIRDDFPKPQSLSVVSWEWTPGQVVPKIEIPMRRAPRALLLFARYATPGPHRATVDPSKSTSLALKRDDMELAIAEKPKLPKSVQK